MSRRDAPRCEERRQLLAAMLVAGFGTTPQQIRGVVGRSVLSRRGSNTTKSVRTQTGYVHTNDGVQLYFEEAGAGKHLVLIHGGGLSLVWWRRNFPVLAEQFHVIAADTRCCGRSDKPTWGHRTARYAKDVYDIIETLGLHDVTLVGWSIGARTCYSYLELFGRHRLRRVVD